MQDSGADLGAALERQYSGPDRPTLALAQTVRSAARPADSPRSVE